MGLRRKKEANKQAVRRNYGNPNPENGKHPQNPCEPCGFFIKKEEHDMTLFLDICWNQERVKDTGRDWQIPNRKGKDCQHFDDRKQQRFGVDI